MVPRSLWAAFSTAFALLLLAAADEELLDDPLAELLPEFPQAVRASTPAATSAAQLAVFLTVQPPPSGGGPNGPRYLQHVPCARSVHAPGPRPAVGATG